ncbi:MAG TPA: NRDE family protein [Steroidobacteraceae bacterium]|nr:NRDE family protein [Steroidobacteraceae bacterium]
MCLILVVWRMHPQYPCLVAANRDEFHARPTARAGWWQDHPQILAGRDLTAGGTWLGLTRAGRFAALTNYRDPELRRVAAPGVATPSRGGLVTAMLESSGSVGEGLAQLRSVGANYNGFNLIFSDGERLGIYESVRGVGRELGPGIYGLSNHLLDTPWPKVQKAKSRLESALAGLTDTAPLLALLRDDRPAADEHLPQTGVSLEWERLLSSAFVRAADYGTRCSTIIRIDAGGRAYFDEWSWDSLGADIGRTSLQFELE